MVNKAELIESGNIKCVPFTDDDMEMLLEVASGYKYNVLSKDEIKQEYNKNSIASWVIFIDGEKTAFCFICKHEFGYKFDAYRFVRNKCESYKIANVVIDWAWKNNIKILWTMHNVLNREATIACLKAGFKKIFLDNTIVIMRRE